MPPAFRIVLGSECSRPGPGSPVPRDQRALASLRTCYRSVADDATTYEAAQYATPFLDCICVVLDAIPLAM